jgi:enoyl-CoA hydratase
LLAPRGQTATASNALPAEADADRPVIPAQVTEGDRGRAVSASSDRLPSKLRAALCLRMHEIVMDGAGKNALGVEMMRFLLGELKQAGGAPVLLRGAGDAFCAGLHLKEVATLDETRAEPFLRLLEECMSAFYLYPGPTVAAVNGHAVAGGCVLALSCDLRVATSSPSVKIGINEVAVGLRFPPRVLAIVRSRVPCQHRDRVLLGGALYAPAEARELGLVDEIDADPIALARRRLEQLASGPAGAYAVTKRDLRGASPQDLASELALDRWLSESVATWTSSETKARIAGALRR